MPLVTASRSSLADRVISQLKLAITSGDWPVGTRIPPEGELASSLGVGRNTVREAVRALAHGGLVEVRQGDGTYVRATTELSGALRVLGGSELREVLEVRRSLEVQAARLAAARRSEEDLAELRLRLDNRNRAFAVATADRDPDQPLDVALAVAAHADTAFHMAVVQSAHNGFLAELYRGLVEAVAESVATTIPYTEKVDAHLHDGLFAAIESGAVDRAGEEAARHLDRFTAQEGGRS